MHILFLLTQDLASPSGLGRYWPLARYLAQRGHTVEIAALHPAWHTLAQREFERDGVRVRYVAQMHIQRDGVHRTYFNPLALLWVTAWATLALARAAWQSRAEVIHIGKAQPMNGLAGWLGSRWPRRRRLYLDYDDYEAATNHFGAAWQRSVIAWWEDRLPGVVRGVTVNTTFLRDRLLSLGVPAERIRLVPNGFDPARFPQISTEEIEALRRAWCVGGAPVVTYVGSLSLANHSVLLLLAAFVCLRRKLPEAQLCLVGGGEDYDRVVQEVHALELTGSVHLLGVIPAEKVGAAYAASQVTVDPVDDDVAARSRSPLKLVEALACGVPVVTGAIGDRATILTDAIGRLVAPGSAAALADGLYAVLTEPLAPAQRAAACRNASQPFRWDRLVAVFESVYVC
jgi:glycosyltransferase involved in cell wall biosynthesis